MKYSYGFKMLFIFIYNISLKHIPIDRIYGIIQRPILNSDLIYARFLVGYLFRYLVYNLYFF